MFLRTVKAAGGKGVQYEYVRLVEAYREHGKNKQRVVCHLGRKDLLAAHLEALIRLLRGEPGARATPDDGQAMGAWDWGPALVARTVWQRGRAGGHSRALGRAESARRGRARGAGAGAGDQPLMRPHERARPGALVGDGRCV